ncbi:two-component system sensor histidine kinase [unidentified eubacterium SCB49]|nr:two-component system sensor histidine kinase [unidentified eubacterium SCB49]
MESIKKTLTLKVIASYVLLSSIAIFVCIFLYQQLNQNRPSTILDEKNIINTSSIISSLYEADSYGALSIQSLRQKDFDIYTRKNDSIIKGLTLLKLENHEGIDNNKLDTIANLLNQKRTNIEQLRLIKAANNKDNSLDKILSEFEILELNMGRVMPYNIVEDLSTLTDSQRETVIDFTNYINSKKTTVSSKVIDSMLTATREIVRNAQSSSLRLRKALLEKENILAHNNIAISTQLRQIISNLSNEIDNKQRQELLLRNKAIYTSNRVVKIAGFSGAFLILLFSYFIITDFFKAQRLKNELQEEQDKTNSLLQSRERLMATVGHDLKTPLTTITGYTQLLDKTNLDVEQKNFNNAIHDNTQYISHLAQDLLDFSELEAQNIKITNAPFNLYNLLQKIMNDAVMRHSNPKIKGIVVIDEALKHSYFESDAMRIEQVVINLISNAFKFTEKGEIKLTVNQQRGGNNKIQTTLTVSDSGIGIAPEKIKTIFEPFTQADKNIIKKYGGSGLGLAISKRLALLLQGSLTVKSIVNKGSDFIFSIPLIEVEKPITTHSLPSKTFKKGIVIDDDIGLLTLLKALFNSLEIEVFCFSSFVDFQKNTPAHFDFLLTDMQMPTDTGFEILQKLKKGVVSAYSNQPIFLMSGNLQYEKNYYLNKGFSGVIAKPFTIEKLGDLLNISAINTIKPIDDTPTDELKSQTSFSSSTLETFLSDPEVIKEVITIFIDETKKNIQTLAKAIELNNNSLIEATAHKMTTMAKQLEATKVINLLNKIEHNRNMDQVKALYNELDVQTTLLIEELNHYLHQ